MFNYFWEPATMKKGDYMTRICAVADTNKIVMSADSMFINTFNGKKTFHNKKIAYGKNILIGILGHSEFFLSNQKEIIQIQKMIQNILQNVYFEDARNTIIYILKELRPIYEIINDNQFTQLLCIWTENNHFYKVAIELSNKTLHYPLGNMRDKNTLLFENSILEVGEGVDGIETTPLDVSDSLLDISGISYEQVYQAIQDTSLENVGGDVYSVALNINGTIDIFLNNVKQ